MLSASADGADTTDADVAPTTAHLISKPLGAPEARLPPPACHWTVAVSWPVAATCVITGRDGAALPEAVETYVYVDHTLHPCELLARMRNLYVESAPSGYTSHS